MRIAIISDIHGNRTAFEAVLKDLRQTAPDFVLHGGDLADGGSSPVEIVDQVRDLGWQGVMGNTDEMLIRKEALTEFASRSPKLQPLFAVIAEMAAAARECLGEDRLAGCAHFPGSNIMVHWHWFTPAQKPRGERLRPIAATKNCGALTDLSARQSLSTDTFIAPTSAIFPG